MGDPIRIVSWNICRSPRAWDLLIDQGVDVGLLQEAQPPPQRLQSRVQVESTPWITGQTSSRPWRTTVVRLSDRVQVRALAQSPLDSPDREMLGVSLGGTLAVAEVTLLGTGEIISMASMYGSWERPAGAKRWIYADASVHRLISDLSALISSQRGHKIIAAGDLNILKGYGEYGNRYWRARYGTVFERMEALGMGFVGPEAPRGGRQADPWPEELPEGSKNVPTYRTSRDKPETATRQLDFVFASGSLKSRLRVAALNSPDEWGPSDHCRVLIEIHS